MTAGPSNGCRSTPAEKGLTKPPEEPPMSRHIWLDRTIEAARESEVTMPWSRSPAPVRDTGEAPAAIRAKG